MSLDCFTGYHGICRGTRCDCTCHNRVIEPEPSIEEQILAEQRETNKLLRELITSLS